MGLTMYLLLWTCIICVFLEGECLSFVQNVTVSPSGNITVEEGQPVKLSCRVQGDTSHTSNLKWELPPHFLGIQRALSTRWRIERILSNNRQIGLDLIVDEAVMEDTGKFVCRLNGIYKDVYVTIKPFTNIHEVNIDTHGLQEVVEMSIVPQRQIQIMEGDSVRINCTVNLSRLYTLGTGNIQLAWVTKKHKVHQRRVDNSTVTLVIDNANSSDAGFYTCYLNSSLGSAHKLFHILVISRYIPVEGGAFRGTCNKSIDEQDQLLINSADARYLDDTKDGAVCATSQFLCTKQRHCIFIRYRCNGRNDCEDGSDENNCEENPCLDKFHCHNGRCLNWSQVCDANHENDCGDWSDEQCLKPPIYFATGNESTVDTPSGGPPEGEQMTWLKTTVYAVIGCTVGIVIFISIIVVAVFRIRMKRDACRQGEQVSHHGRSPPSSRSHHTRRTRARETQPFIEERQNYGNIIVNVNNGVQYVPVSEFLVMESPPTYSEVEDEIREQRNSPPPEYSTLDRFPQRPNSLQVTTSTGRRTQRRHARRHGTSPNANQDTLPPYTGGDNRSRPPTQNVSVQTTRSQGGGSGPSGCGQITHVRDSERAQTNTTPSRPASKLPNIAVRGGQIILRDQQHTTISGCIQTSVVSNTGSNSANIEVQGGQIVFSGQDAPLSEAARNMSSTDSNEQSSSAVIHTLPTLPSSDCSSQAPLDCVDQSVESTDAISHNSDNITPHPQSGVSQDVSESCSTVVTSSPCVPELLPNPSYLPFSAVTDTNVETLLNDMEDCPSEDIIPTCHPGTSSVITPPQCEVGVPVCVAGQQKSGSEGVYEVPWEENINLGQYFAEEESSSTSHLPGDYPIQTNAERENWSSEPVLNESSGPHSRSGDQLQCMCSSPSVGDNHKTIGAHPSDDVCIGSLSGPSNGNIQVLDGRICLSNQNTFPRMSSSQHSQNHSKTPEESSHNTRLLKVCDGNIVLT